MDVHLWTSQNLIAMNKNLSFCYPQSVPIGSDVIADESKRLADKYAKYCCNDDTIINIIFKLADKTGALNDDVDITQRDQYPPEINYVLSQLQQKYPAVGAFEDDESAFMFIRDRYMQSAGEIEPFVNQMVTYINDVQAKAAASQSAPPAENV